MLKKYFPLLLIILLLTAILSLWLYPSATLALGLASLLFSLAIAIRTIFQTHKGTENARLKIFKEVGVMVLTLVVVIFLGGIAAMLANTQVSMRWGEVAGLLSAIGASVLVGYLVRAGLMRLAVKF